MNPKEISYLTIFLLLGSVFGFSVAALIVYQPQLNQFYLDITDYQNKIINLETEKTILELNLTTNIEKYNQLFNYYHELQIDYNELTYQYEMKVIENSQINNQYNQIESNYNLLSNQYNQLESIYDVQQKLSVGNSLTSFYDNVRYEYGLSGDKNYWGNDKDLLLFATKLARHDLGYSMWSDIENEYYQVVSSYSYNDAKKILDYVINECKIFSYDTPTDKISKILNLIEEQIHYEPEVDDVYRSPIETLSLRSGDCDDYSILTSSLLEYAKIDAALGSFKNAENQYHWMVLVHLDSLDLVDPYYVHDYYLFNDLTSFGLRAGKWIIIEPQRTLNYQGDPEWFEQWTIIAAAEIP
ncbi:hypothetical protein JW865_04145 [Candidatus Bathyarchaeota archaeon]|nr:hypothetical protein [Candidatus Bathyarchaeota archaeon]